MSQDKHLGADAVSARSLHASYWSWPPFVLGAVLLLPSYIIAVTTPPDRSFAMPGPGKTTLVEVTNNKHFKNSSPEVGLFYTIAVDPVTTVDMPKRSPVPCRFRLVSVQSGKTIAEVSHLKYVSEFVYGHQADFGSNLFKMPMGKTWVALTNDGCPKDYAWGGGLGAIGPTYGDTSLVPLGAMFLQSIGLFLFALGFCVALVRYLRAKLFTPSEVMAGERT